MKEDNAYSQRYKGAHANSQRRLQNGIENSTRFHCRRRKSTKIHYPKLNCNLTREDSTLNKQPIAWPANEYPAPDGHGIIGNNSPIDWEN